VGSFDIELVQEGIEAGLLLQAVHTWRARGFLLQSEVHAFMAAVLLWLSGLDAFDSDAEAEPPDRELGEIEQGIGAGEGNAIIGTDGERQSALCKQPFEGGDGCMFAR
jgi:hypothetical protein